MAAFDRYNDGTQNPPRLQVQHSLWSLIGLPMNSLWTPNGHAAPREADDDSPGGEWTLDEKFARVKAAGFEGVECWLDDPSEAAHRSARIGTAYV